MPKRAQLTAICSALLALSPLVASAATRPCFDVIIAFGTDPSEQEARRKALLAWSKTAARHGEAFTSWRLAWQKTIDCGRMPQGAFQCRAVGKPCGISNVPGNLPPGTIPVPRAKPGSA